MKTFSNYLEEEGLDGFLKDHGLDDDWKAYKNKPKPIVAPPEQSIGWKSNPNETVRDINYIIKGVIDHTTKVNNFGIENIKFDVINTEEIENGLKITMEAQGVAYARNSDHIKKQLEKVMMAAKPQLKEKGIYMEMLYNKIDTNDSVEEANEPAVGLVRKIDFRIVCAVISTKQRS